MCSVVSDTIKVIMQDVAKLAQLQLKSNGENAKAHHAPYVAGDKEEDASAEVAAVKMDGAKGAEERCVQGTIDSTRDCDGDCSSCADSPACNDDQQLDLANDPSGERILNGLATVCKTIAAEQVDRPTGEAAAKFCGRSCPAIPIGDYLIRLHHYFACSDTCLVMSLVYMDRISSQDEQFTICRWNLHRVLATSLVIAAKFFDDVYFSNKFFAQVCGVSVQELNKLEAKFLKLIDWRLQVTPEQYSACLRRLMDQD